MAKKAPKLFSATPTDPVLKHWREAVPDDRLAHLVKDATRSFLRSMQSRLAEHGVLLGHWTFLRVLWQQDGLTQRELSDEAGVMEQSTMSAIKSMEAAGYVTRQKLEGNKKNSYVFLTAKGKRLKRALVPLAENVNNSAVRNLSDEDIATTRRCLLSIIENLSQERKLP